jgi:hypothetical protein
VIGHLLEVFNEIREFVRCLSGGRRDLLRARAVGRAPAEIGARPRRCARGEGVAPRGRRCDAVHRSMSTWTSTSTLWLTKVTTPTASSASRACARENARSAVGRRPADRVPAASQPARGREYLLRGAVRRSRCRPERRHHHRGDAAASRARAREKAVTDAAPRPRIQAPTQPTRPRGWDPPLGRLTGGDRCIARACARRGRSVLCLRRDHPSDTSTVVERVRVPAAAGARRCVRRR